MRKKSKKPGKNEGTVAMLINLPPDVSAKLMQMAAEQNKLRKPFIEEILINFARNQN